MSSPCIDKVLSFECGWSWVDNLQCIMCYYADNDVRPCKGRNIPLISRDAHIQQILKAMHDD